LKLFIYGADMLALLNVGQGLLLLEKKPFFRGRLIFGWHQKVKEVRGVAFVTEK